MKISLETEQFVLENTGASKLTNISLIQNVWSNYGQILRIGLLGAETTSVVVKIIQSSAHQKHPRAWNSTLGHSRKLRSYQVEHYWYQHYASRCKMAAVPRCVALGRVEDALILVLEDLSTCGFPLRLQQLNWQQLKVCIRWLACFHATFMHQRPVGLWPIGTYWHLATRPEELKALDDKALQQAAAAIDKGKFNDQIVPVEVEDVFVKDGKKITTSHIVSMDEGVRRDTTINGLAKLRPVFKKGGVITAGNSSQTSDGAAFTLIVSEAVVKKLNLTPIARLVAYSVGGVEPLYMGIGPCVAIPKAIKQAGLKLSDIEQTELNEAFAAQALAVIQEARLNPETVNVNGGALALGHPLGCTGAKLSIQLLGEMKLRGQRYGMVTACVGGGQGIAGIFERL